MSLIHDERARAISEFLEIAGKMVMPVANKALSVRIAVDSGDTNVTYVGESAVGSETSSDVWRIKKIDTTSGTIVTWADSDENFDNVWDDRESLDYG